MIGATLAKFGVWIRDTAWPGVTSAYANHEGIRHLVTLAFGLFVGAVFF